MVRVNVISGRSRIPNFTTYPLRYNVDRLKNRGYNVSIFYSHRIPNLSCDILCVSCKFLHKWWKRDKDRVFSFLAHAKKYTNKLIYLDDKDSTSTTDFEVLPFVDLYLKKQLLRDRQLYGKSFYGDRIFTDFYHKTFGITDENERFSETIDMEKQGKKIDLSWHIGLGNMIGDIMKFSRIMGPIKALLPPSYDVALHDPFQDRNIDIMARGRRYYSRNTVRFHRERIGTLLDGMGNLRIATNGHVSVRRYRKEMRQAKLVVSSFGWGEIGVRDFEAFIYGAALVKPDMTHLETWPNIFIPGVTYQPIKWDFENLEDIIENLLSCPKGCLELAAAGQETYKKSISARGMERFCDWFVQQITL